MTYSKKTPVENLTDDELSEGLEHIKSRQRLMKGVKIFGGGLTGVLGLLALLAINTIAGSGLLTLCMVGAIACSRMGKSYDARTVEIKEEQTQRIGYVDDVKQGKRTLENALKKAPGLRKTFDGMAIPPQAAVAASSIKLDAMGWTAQYVAK